ncbi:MAG: septum site-determining protein MinC [Clostridium sp.]|nr:septum site-determining protein MinC [Clostridium sp.]
MKDAVILKSYRHGILIFLPEDLPFEQVLREVAFKFTESRSFFGTAKMALSFEGRILSREEEQAVLETIKACSDVNIVCIVGKEEETDKYFLRALEQLEQKLTGGDEGQFYRGTLKNKEILETDASVVVLGDVYPGSAVISARNIIILGGLYGEAYAGGNGADAHYVVALEMEPERLKIGDFKYKHTGKQRKWGIHLKVQPKIAYVRDGRIVFEPLTKELLGDLTR